MTVVLTSSESGFGDNPWRLMRLMGTLGVFADLLGKQGLGDCVTSVTSLHDHEGRLTVTWVRTVSVQVRALMTEAWRRQNEELIEHVVDRRRG